MRRPRFALGLGQPDSAGRQMVWADSYACYSGHRTALDKNLLGQWCQGPGKRATTWASAQGALDSTAAQAVRSTEPSLRLYAVEVHCTNDQLQSAVSYHWKQVLLALLNHREHSAIRTLLHDMGVVE